MLHVGQRLAEFPTPGPRPCVPEPRHAQRPPPLAPPIPKPTRPQIPPSERFDEQARVFMKVARVATARPEYSLAVQRSLLLASDKLEYERARSLALTYLAQRTPVQDRDQGQRNAIAHAGQIREEYRHQVFADLAAVVGPAGLLHVWRATADLPQRAQRMWTFDAVLTTVLNRGDPATYTELWQASDGLPAAIKREARGCLASRYNAWLQSAGTELSAARNFQTAPSTFRDRQV